jgi:hypothetical protein
VGFVRFTSAKLGRRVTMMVCVTMRVHSGDAVLRTLLVDRVRSLIAELARNALVLVLRLSRAELRLIITRCMTVAMCPHGGDTVRGADLVNGVSLLRAKLAPDAFVFAALDR